MGILSFTQKPPKPHSPNTIRNFNTKPTCKITIFNQNPETGTEKERVYERTAKWARLTMVQAMPGEQPKIERTRSQAKKRIRM